MTWGRRLAFKAFALALLAGAGPINASAHPHNTLDIIQPPQPSFPEETVAPGRCEVRFEMSDYTKIKVTQAECSDYIFCKAARIAVEGARLRVIDNKGEEGPGVIKNAVYPLDFIFDPVSDAQLKWIESQPMFPCDQSMMF